MRYSALSAVVLTLLITFAYYQGWFYFAFGMTFLLAVQSAIYSPAKYGFIKELVGEENIGSANGVVQAVTIAAILLSSMIFSIIFESSYSGDNTSEILQSVTLIGWLLVILSILESFFTFKIPLLKYAKSYNGFSIKSYLKLTYLKENLKTIKSDENIWLSIIGLSIFWGIGQILVAAFPAHYKIVTGDENAVIVQAVLAISAVGLVMGSFLAGRMSKDHIELGIVPLGSFGIFASLLILMFTTNTSVMMFSSVMFGFFGGLVIVPLNATIQYFAKDEKLGVVLAGNNFIQNIFMFLFLASSIVFVYLGFDSKMLFISGAFITLFSAFYAVIKLPHLFIRILLLPILKTKYTLKVRGVEHIPKSGGVLLLGNHISWIDWLVVQASTPRAIKFVMLKSIYNKWYIYWFVKHFNVIPISNASSRESIKEIRNRLDNGEVVALFPEGRISYNGHLSEFRKGFELAMRDSNHPIIPFHLHGLWGSTFSRADERFKKLTRDGVGVKVIVSFGEALNSDATAEQVKQRVTQLSYEAWDMSISNQKPLQYNWLKNAKARVFKRSIVDALGTDLNNLKVITGVLLFVDVFKNLKGKNIGVILPSSAVGAIVNMALLVVGKRAVNLNYTLSNDAMNGAIEKAEIESIISSQKFMNKLASKGFELSDATKEKVITAESIGESFSKAQRISKLMQALFVPGFMLEMLYFKKCSLDDTAAILFSSGSEGVPKGIELTHKNLLTNVKQVSALLNFQEKDVILNSLPIFHSFGYTVTTLLPMSEGVEMISMPDPTDAMAIGKMAAKYQASIMFGTSTFYRIYAKNKKLFPLMFSSIRMAVAGAEKLKPEIKSAFKEKFGLELYEGYGATETAPVVSVNMPDALDLDTMQVVTANKHGTVGQAIPGTIVKIVNPETFEELPLGDDGLIIVGGSQVMKGYLKDSEKTDEAIAEIDGIRYYKTGDKGHLDSDGFITIVDRYSRFAKIGGEMISLGSVEEQLHKLFGNAIELIATNVNDEKKGEQIVVLFSGDLSEEELNEEIKISQIIPIMRPSKVIKLDEVPKLASGKADFKGAKTIAEKSFITY
jgi:acyl-[acyl-carrier-protein]-phospholipid O-acyltransferase/long-chain-fatty-acid--[acyl-carrier-protein] ligase